MRAWVRLYWLSLAVGLVHASAAAAQDAQSSASAARRVVLISPGDELLRAARAALEPWQVELLVLTEVSPGAEAPHANEVARELALAHGASAVVWVSEQAQRHALWVYDLEGNRAIERPLDTPPPFDEATAAAVALSVKTLLRHGATAPEEERYGAPNAREERGEREPELPERAPVVTQASSRSKLAAADEGERLSPANAPRRPSFLDFEALIGFGFNLTPASSELPRFGLSGQWWPNAGPFGLGLGLLTGPGMRIDEPLLQARLYDIAPVAAAFVRTNAGRALRLSAGVGAGLHFVLLDGSLLREGEHTRVTRIAPTAQLELGADWLLASELFVGVHGSAALVLSTQRYFAREERVLELSRVAFGAGLRLGWALAR